MTGFKNMKKIVAVLVLALVAMTAVFAAVNENADQLTISLNVDAVTTVGFTKVALDASAASLDALTSDTVEAGKNYTVYASYITTSKTPVTVTVTVEDNLVHETVKTEKIAITKPATMTFNETGDITGKRANSFEIVLGIGSDVNKLAGTYSANVNFSVTAE